MVSRVHHCLGQIDVAEERKEPPAPNCRCRKYISIERATQIVKSGDASWVVVGRTTGPADIVCSICKGSKDVVNCSGCKGVGTVVKTVVWNKYNNDIVLVSQLPDDEREKKRSSVLKKKTPRVATIEEAHIERAYVEGNKAAQERIEEYGYLILDARAFIGRDRIPMIKTEPADNPKTHEGRTYDWGRAI